MKRVIIANRYDNTLDNTADRVYTHELSRRRDDGDPFAGQALQSYTEQLHIILSPVKA